MNDADTIKEIDQFFVLDLDRTLADTDKLYELLDTVVTEQTSLAVQELCQARQSIESHGVTFDTIGFLRQHLGEEFDWPTLEQAYIRRGTTQRQELLEPHADELLTILKDRSILHGIVTYGYEAWQLVKLEATGLITIPHLVTRLEEKGAILSGWKHGDHFAIPPALSEEGEALIAKTLVFIDDKPISFKNLPEGVQGICVRPTNAAPLPVQQGPLPPEVTPVDGLKGAIDLLFSNNM